MRRATTEPAQETRELDWQGLIETALTVEGSTGDTYRRLYDYSTLNVMFVMMQGIEPQPIATFKRWQALGRHVVKGAKAKEIIRPITVQRKDNNGDIEATFTKFKPVRCIFPYSDTAGDDLSPVEHQDWDEDRALKTLDITRVPFQTFEGNTAGYSFHRSVAVSPIAKFPFKTLTHEISHVSHGHTTADKQDEYRQHRGLMEFEAEGSAFLVCNELEVLTEEAASVSRAYCQTWLQGQRPPDSSIRRVFVTTDQIIRAGRLAVEGNDDAR